MKILQTNNYDSSLNFKATYPVVHWVAETNGSFAPISDLKLVKKLQGKIIRILNKQIYDSNKVLNPAEQKFRDYAGRCDADYRVQADVRSFYDRITSDISGQTPVVYVISGKDIKSFEEQLAKNIGIKKSEAIKTIKTAYSPEAKAAIEAYNKNGLEYVNNNEIRIKDKKGMTYVLHTKFQIIRNKLGKIKDYKFLDARFLPEYGKNNPFERLK